MLAYIRQNELKELVMNVDFEVKKPRACGGRFRRVSSALASLKGAL